MHRTAKEWKNVYEARQALWIHDGNPRRPHVILTSEKHSNGFFNSELVMEDTKLLDEACYDLVQLLLHEGLNLSDVDRVVGPAMGAITLANDISRHIGHQRRRACLRSYTEKVGEGASKQMVFKKTRVKSGEKVLYVEDVLTTGSSVQLMNKPIEEAGATILPFVAVLVNRSGLTQVGHKKIVALIDYPMPSWEPSECPFCPEGSEAIRAKDNWGKLTRSY